MANKIITLLFRMALILMALFTLVLQLIDFIFGVGNKSSSTGISSAYIEAIVEHIFIFIICIWFIVHQIKLLSKKED